MIFLTRSFVVHYHRVLIDTFGGSHGIRDEALLDSALAQPRATFGGQLLHDGIPEVAAAYAFHLANNHPFMDGNKRIAAAALGAFLEVNGQTLDLDEVQFYQLIIGVASGEVDKADLTEIVRSHLVPTDSGAP